MLPHRKRKEELLGAYPYRIELHAHSLPQSGCAEHSPEDVVGIYRELGYHAILLTNHFIKDYRAFSDPAMTKEEHLALYLADYERAKKRGDELGMKVYLGAEVRFTENVNDYLLIGADKEILSLTYDWLSRGVVAFRREVSLPRSLFIQAHPLRDNMTEIDPSLLDGMEVFNTHPGQNSRIGLAARLAKASGIEIITAGSDFHSLARHHEGTCALRLPVLPTDSFALAEVIRSGDYVIELGRSIVLP